MAWRYRDSLTGRWVSQDTYLRSTSHGGKRYKKESDVDYGEKPEPPARDIPRTLDDYYDYGYEGNDYDEIAGSVDYEG